MRATIPFDQGVIILDFRKFHEKTISIMSNSCAGSIPIILSDEEISDFISMLEKTFKTSQTEEEKKKMRAAIPFDQGGVIIVDFRKLQDKTISIMSSTCPWGISIILSDEEISEFIAILKKTFKASQRGEKGDS